METKDVKTRDLILAIISLPKQATKLREKGKRYENTLIELLKLDYYDDDQTLPTSKELYAEIGITPSIFRRHIVEIFEDLYAMIWDYENLAIKIDEVVYDFYVRTNWNGSFSFRCKLPECPRIGEYIRLPILRHYMGGFFYYVDNITHHIENDKQIIELWVHEGYYNPYYKMKRSEQKYFYDKEKYKRMYKDVVL